MLGTFGHLVDAVLIAISVIAIVLFTALYLRITVLFPVSKMLCGDYRTLDDALCSWIRKFQKRWH